MDASVENYDDVMVTLLGDVAANYVAIRTDQQRITLLQKNVKLQDNIISVVRRQLEAGYRDFTAIELSRNIATLKQTQANVIQIEIDLRERMHALCVLLDGPRKTCERPLTYGAPWTSDLWNPCKKRTSPSMPC